MKDSKLSPWLFIIGAAIVFIPNLYLHGAELWEQEQYQYFPFVFAAVGYLWWTRSNEASLRNEFEQKSKYGFIPYLFIAVALPLLFIAIYCQWAWLAAVAFNLFLGAFVYRATRRYHIQNAWGIWLLMWLIVPPPIEFGVVLVQRLQLASSRLSSSILDMLGILHILEGNVLSLPTKQLFVDEACSGIVSVMSVVAVVAIFAVWANRSFLHFLALVVAGVFWAVIMNTTRICIVALAEAKYEYNLADGTPHDMLGLVLFVVTFVAVLSTDRLLLFLFSPIPVVNFAGDSRGNVLVRMWNASVGWLTPKKSETQSGGFKWSTESFVCVPGSANIVLAVLLIVGGLWTTLVQAGMIGTLTPAFEAELVEEIVGEEVLPTEISEWKKVSFETLERNGGDQIRGTEFGRFSKQFSYANGDISAIVSLDFPFKGGWHELSACYRMVGWTVVSRSVQNDENGDFVATELKKGDEVYGYLLFSNFSDNGVVLSPASSAVLSRSWFFVRRRLLREISRNVYQTQVFVTSNRQLTDLEKNGARQLFEFANSEFTDELRELAQTAGNN